MASASFHYPNVSSAPTVTLTVTQYVQDPVENNTLVLYSLEINRPSNISSTALKYYEIIIDGRSVRSGNVSIGGSGNKVLGSGSHLVSHNADGTKDITFSFSLEMNITWSGTLIGNATGNGTMTLTTIPRATTPTLSASNLDMGNVVTINSPRAQNTFTHTLRYSFAGTTGTIATDITTSYSWTVPLTLANAIPNTVSASCTILCDTYSGTSLVGTKTVNLTLNVPASVVPVISSVSITEGTTGIAAKFQAYVQSKSTLAVAISASGAYGSTIITYETYIQAVPYRAASFTSEIITASGTVGIITTVTDSRGRTKQVSNSITVIAYSPPKITSMSAYRVDTSGNVNTDGERIAIDMNFSISPVSNKNDHTFEIQYRLESESSFATISSGSASWSYNNTQKFLNSPVISINNTYVVRLEISDFFQTVTADFEIPTAFTLIDIRSTGKGIAFGKVSEEDRMEIDLDVEITGTLIQADRQIPTLLNGWTDYGSGYEVASYWKDTCGVVHFSGLIDSGTATANTVLFVLPVGYRPRASEKFIVVSFNALCVIDVYADGNVTIRAGANSDWLSLSGIQFRAV